MPLPIQFLLLMLVGWVSRQQQDVIAYLKAENEALREQLGGKRLRFTDAQRRRLARAAKLLGRRQLRGLSPIVTPDTLLRWYRELVARSTTGARDAVRADLGSPAKSRVDRRWRRHPRWGYTRSGSPRESRVTIAETRSSGPRENGIDPAAGGR